MKELPAHSSRSIAIGGLVGGVVMLAWSGGDATRGGAGLVLLGLGAWQWRQGMALQLLNASSAAVNRGDLTAARELIALGRARHSMPFVRAFLDAQEVTIAWLEGDKTELARAIAKARASKGWSGSRSAGAAHRAAIEARRALLSALLGDEASANEAAVAVRATGEPLRAVAEAELAQGVLLARRGDHETLRDHLARWRVLLTEVLDPRGRALHQALRRMTQRAGSSAYRVPATSAPSASSTGGTAAWLSRMFPEGAALVELDDGANVGQTLAVPTDAPEPSRIQALKRRSRRRAARIAGMLLVVPATFLAVWFMAVAMRDGWISWAAGVSLSIALSGGLLAAFVGIFVLMIRRAAAQTSRVARANRLLLTGDLERAEAEVRPLRDDENVRIAASASLVLTEILLRRAELERALDECDRGMALLVGGLAVESSDDLMPSFVAARATLLGALGHDAESDAELVRLSREFPTFAGAPGAVLSTKLVRAVRRGDLEQARELARVRAEVSIGAYADALAELAIADGAADREDRLAALREELSAMPSLNRWVRTIAPSALTSDRSVEL